LGAGGDQRGIAHPYRGGVAGDGLDRFHGDEGILAAADGNEGALGEAKACGEWRVRTLSPSPSPASGRGERSGARKGNPSAQVQPVAVGELGQTVQIQRVEQVGGGVVERAV